jgi:hypothetical protein
VFSVRSAIGNKLWSCVPRDSEPRMNVLAILVRQSIIGSRVPNNNQIRPTDNTGFKNTDISLLGSSCSIVIFLKMSHVQFYRIQKSLKFNQNRYTRFRVNRHFVLWAQIFRTRMFMSTGVMNRLGIRNMKKIRPPVQTHMRQGHKHSKTISSYPGGGLRTCKSVKISKPMFVTVTVHSHMRK